MSDEQHTTPLDDDEYEQLDELLSKTGGQAMDVAALEGFLTAIVIGPADIAQEQWLPKVWGEQPEAGAEAATSLVLRHYHYMRTWMKQDPSSFEPIYECGGSWSAQAWCDGFLAGVQLDAQAWAPLRASQPALLLPFQRAGNGWQAKVTPAVIQINAFWHAPQSKPVKVGRNNPCPCGSGKKFKKCCGGDE